MTNKGIKKNKIKPFPFEDSLALFKYILSLFGEESLDNLCEGMKPSHIEGLDENNISHFYTHLTNKLFDLPKLPKDLLLQYDQNIVSHTLRISQKRGNVSWKYFQYMSLLFTEIYLDMYFKDSHGLLKDLNDLVHSMNMDRVPGEYLDTYAMDDLKKVAYWQATGSGKTLIMHINMLQYHYYLHKYDKHAEINKTILLTPNEGLSYQHNIEFKESGLGTKMFNKDSIGGLKFGVGDVVDILLVLKRFSRRT